MQLLRKMEAVFKEMSLILNHCGELWNIQESLSGYWNTVGNTGDTS